MAQSTFRSQNVKSTPRSDHFWTLNRHFVWQAQWILHLAKSEQNVRVSWPLQKSHGRCGTFEENLDYTALHYTPWHFTTLQLQLQVPIQLQAHYNNNYNDRCNYNYSYNYNYNDNCDYNYHYSTLDYSHNYTTVHCTTLHYATPHYTTSTIKTTTTTTTKTTTAPAPTTTLQLQLH